MKSGAEPSQKSWCRAEAEAESPRPSQDKADGRRGKAKARQAKRTASRRPRAETDAFEDYISGYKQAYGG